LGITVSTLIKTITFSVLAIALAACGGGNSPETAAQQPKMAASVRLGAQASSATDYYPLVQQLYISYFGRPADSAALVNFAAQMVQLDAPPGIRDLTGAYDSNASIKTLIDSFGTSAESAALYSGDNEAFVTAIFTNVLGRSPAAAGKAFWIGALDAGTLTRANASLAIMSAALVNTSDQGLLDAKLINNRVTVSQAFTSALNSDTRVNAYKGKTAAATVRAMLASVGATTDTTAFNTTVEATINTLVANAVPSFATISGIVGQRCLSCHSGGGAQAGVRLDSEAGIRSNAQQVYSQVVSRGMPLGNATGMTDAERDLVKRWFEGGAN
jgi:hypothetical protein